jgi:pyruvate/2-oxoglutarate dehydrogenase complex dihydrolipoamide acyltransferase (E2) component
MEVDGDVVGGNQESGVADEATVVGGATTATGDKTIDVSATPGALVPASTTRPAREDEADLEQVHRQAKRRRLNEIRRYDVDSGGAIGVGMGIVRDDDRVVIDDLDPKYVFSTHDHTATD